MFLKNKSSSTIVLDGLPIHLAYIVEDSALFLIAAPSNWYFIMLYNIDYVECDP